MALSKIVRGCDFSMEVHVITPQWTVSGQIWEEFNINECTNVGVNLICTKDQVVIPLSWHIKEDTTNVIICDVQGKYLHSGAVYALEIIGLDAEGKAWRYKNKSVFAIVDATKDAVMQEALMADPLEVNAEIGLVVNVIPVLGPQGPQGDRGQDGVIGRDGAQGPKGDQGDRGIDGVQGPKGDQGDRGIDGVQGPKGDQGDRGIDGVQGPQGPQGEKGQDGSVSFDDLTPEQKEELRGPQGEKGDTGAQGEKGDTGAQGDKGDTGPQGEQGLMGEQGPQGEQGLMGEQGPQGDKGDTGAQGDKGDTGAQGDKGDIGPQGEQGLMGEQGPQGDKGDTGPQGDKGDTGAQGDKGDTGAQGVKGDTGAQGDKGDRGYQGFQGTQGPKGEQGARGFTGDSGIVDLYNEAVALGLYDGTLEDFTDTFLEWGYSGYQASNELILKQDNLVSGQNIKTINNESILGSGNITIPSGAQGDKGDTGFQGPQGDAGAQGERGLDGAQGPQGEKGDTGAQGERGLDGAQGPQGDAGPQGPQGAQGPAGDGADIDIEPAKIVIDEQMPSNPDPNAVYMISQPINITPYPSLTGAYNSGTYTLFLRLYDMLNKKLFSLGRYAEENNLSISLIIQGSNIRIYLNSKWAYTLDVYFKTPSSTSPATITDGSVQLNNNGDIEFRIEGSASDLGIDLHLSTGYWAPNIIYSLDFDPFGTISTVISHS